MTDDRKPKKPLGLRAFAGVMVACLVLGGVIGALGSVLDSVSSPLAMLVVPVGAALAMVLSLAACVWWWRGIDEAAREAHKWAWWWGGSGGISVGGVLLLTLIALDDDALADRFGTNPAEAFMGGIAALLFLQMVGYSVAWAGWWLKHR